MRLLAGLGIVVSLLLVVMKLLPIVPGHFTRAEWSALGIWVALGVFLRRRASRAPNATVNQPPP